MEWKLFATLAETAGESEVAVDDALPTASEGTSVSEAATVGDALDALLATHPALADQVLTDGKRVGDGELREHLRLLVDGRDPFREGDGLAEPVDADAELALFPPVSGG